jgi:rhodanese-related sulfurtransferase
VAEVAGQASAVDALLAEARAGLDRVTAGDLPTEMAAGALVVDTRPVDQRDRDGALRGAVVVDRNVLEWRLDPTSPHRIHQVTSADLRIVVVCNEGFSSSLAAASLRRLGLHRATDLVDGFQALLAARSDLVDPVRRDHGLHGTG